MRDYANLASVLLLASYLAPVGILIVLTWRTSRKSLRRDEKTELNAAAAGLIGAVAASAITVAIIAIGGEWPHGIEIAWTGLQALKPGAAISLGGREATALIGWAPNVFAPGIQILPVSSSEADLTVSEGGGFLSLGDEPLNGDPLSPDERFFADGISVNVPREGIIRINIENSEYVEIEKSRKQTDDCVYIADLVSREVARLRASGHASDAAVLEQWASHAWLLVPAHGAYRITLRENRVEQRIPVPSQLRILWPKRSLQMRVRYGHDDRLNCEFDPPWRNSTPIPPGQGDEIRFALTGKPQPGDVAFVLPFGDAIPLGQGGMRLSWKKQARPRSVLLPENADFAGVIASQILVVTGFQKEAKFDIEFSAIQDLPTWRNMLWTFIPGLLSLIAGLGLQFLVLPRALGRGVRKLNYWAVAALTCAVWTFCSIRLLLAYRFAQDPAFIDRHAVQGLENAGAALVLAPSLILLAFALRSPTPSPDRGDVAARNRVLIVLGHVLIMILCGLWATRLAGRLWPNVHVGVNSLMAEIAQIGLITTVVIVTFLVLQHFFPGALRVVTRAGASIRGFIEFLRYDLTRAWQATGTSGDNRREPLPAGFVFRVVAYALAVLILALTAQHLAGGVRLAEGLIAPIAVYLPATWAWLASRQHYTCGSTTEDFSGRTIALLGVLFFCVPAVIPFVVGDAGSIVVILSLFTPLAIVLLLGGAPRTIAVTLAMCVIVLYAGAVLLYVYPKPLVPVLRRSPATARILTRFLASREGAVSLGALPFARFAPVAAGTQVTVMDIYDAVEHAWEEKAIAAQGKWTGLGFGAAPVRNSPIRQDTIQYDSTFSFYILSEFGVWGGLALLLLYASPLLIVAASGADLFDIGHAFAAVIASAFWLEALFHALMNLGVPATGRSMPLLSVNSSSDLVYWTFAFWLVASMLFHRNDADDENYYSDPVSLFTPVANQVEAKSGLVEDRPPFEPQRTYAYKIALVAAAPTLMLVAVAGLSATIAWSWEHYSKPEPWSDVNVAIERELDKGDMIHFTRTIAPDGGQDGKVETRGDEGTAGTLIATEASRFNDLTPDERREGILPRGPRNFKSMLAAVNDPASYEAILQYFRASDRSGDRRLHPHPFEFRLERNTEEGNAIELGIDTSFNRRTSFAVFHNNSALPVVRWPGQTLLIGPAWVRGHWQSAWRNEDLLPWVGLLAAAVQQRASHSISSGELPARATRLSLDYDLHAAAQRFARTHAIQRHSDILREFGAREALPPRLALTAIRIPSGEVLALGGWPRMTSDRRWRNEYGSLLPPLRWLEEDAPASLRSRYTGDRNFDALVVGSATKPVWAYAVLSRFPSLDQYLYVKGDDTAENDVFGLVIAPRDPWAVKARPGWLDFGDYLAKSDNRYQIRIGFLGLAASDTSAPASVAVDSPVSMSLKESMDPAHRRAWRQVPRFEPQLQFGFSSPQRMANLDSSELADRLHRIFAIGIRSGAPRVRSSFWTGREDDDNGSQSEWAALSPAAVNLRLDSVTDPRTYVSLLLGGGTNRWSNTDLLSAFATVVTGHVIIAHMMPLQHGPTLDQDRVTETFAPISAKLHEGLGRVLSRQGTAPDLGDAVRSVAPGFTAYAKTGTLDERPQREKGSRKEKRLYTSRVLLALVRQQGDQVGSGVAFSLVIERAPEGEAMRLLAQFLRENEAVVRSVLSSDR
jgi:hypothetical protein